MKKVYLSLLSLLWVMGTSLYPATPSKPNIIQIIQDEKLYVSTQGNDSWSGTLPEPNTAHNNGPFAGDEFFSVKVLMDDVSIGIPIT